MLTLTEQPLGVCVLLINPEGTQILLGKRKNAYQAGSFGAPGGHLELGESLEACGRRELKEETGLQAGDLRYIGVVREAQTDFDLIHFIFVCHQWTGEIRVCEPHKCESWNWYRLDQLPNPLMTGHALAIQMFLNGSLFEDRFTTLNSPT